MPQTAPSLPAPPHRTASVGQHGVSVTGGRMSVPTFQSARAAAVQQHSVEHSPAAHSPEMIHEARVTDGCGAVATRIVCQMHHSTGGREQRRKQRARQRAKQRAGQNIVQMPIHQVRRCALGLRARDVRQEARACHDSTLSHKQGGYKEHSELVQSECAGKQGAR